MYVCMYYICNIVLSGNSAIIVGKIGTKYFIWIIFDPIMLFNLAFPANIKVFLVVDAQKLLEGLNTHTHMYGHTYVVKIFIVFPRLYQPDD